MNALQPLQQFANCFTEFADAIGNLGYTPSPVKEPETVLDLTRIDGRLLAVENRLGDIHRIVDRHELRLDAQLGRIVELEIRASNKNGN